MMKRKLELSPDGMELDVEWDNFIEDTSVFIPCVNTNKAIRQMRKNFKRLGWPSPYVEVRIEKGCRGVRIWRVKKCPPSRR